MGTFPQPLPDDKELLARDQVITRGSLALVRDDASPHRPDSLITEFLNTFTSRATQETYRTHLRLLFARVGTVDALTSTAVIAWLPGDALANNTVRSRIATVLSFLAWLDETHGITVDRKPIARLRRSFPKTYGKVQAPHRARWLDHDEAFNRLTAACRDGSMRGLRDEIVIRLGLCGLRVSEIMHLTVSNIDFDRRTIHWMGKGRRARTVALPPTLCTLLTDWFDRYAAAAPSFSPHSPVICRSCRGTSTEVSWGCAYVTDYALWRIVRDRAAAAGLGHVAPHDLRRSAAGILHRSTDEHGAHHFDLLDIQKVLGHADPATTMRSYLDPMDTDVLDRAAVVLD